MVLTLPRAVTPEGLGREEGNPGLEAFDPRAQSQAELKARTDKQAAAKEEKEAEHRKIQAAEKKWRKPKAKIAYCISPPKVLPCRGLHIAFSVQPLLIFKLESTRILFATN